MNVTSRTVPVTRALALLLVTASPLSVLGGQEQPVGRSEAEAARAVAKIVAEPATLTIVAGQTATVRIVAVDAQGNVVADAPMRVGGSRNALFVNRNAQPGGQFEVKGLQAGKHQLVASTASRAAGAPAPVTLTIPVTVTWPAVSRVQIVP